MFSCVELRSGSFLVLKLVKITEERFENVDAWETSRDSCLQDMQHRVSGRLLSGTSAAVFFPNDSFDSQELRVDDTAL